MTMHGEIQHAVVTGGGGGIGAAIVTVLVQSGIKVSLLGRTLESLDRVLDRLGRPITARGVACNVANTIFVPLKELRHATHVVGSPGGPTCFRS